MTLSHTVTGPESWRIYDAGCPAERLPRNLSPCDREEFDGGVEIARVHHQRTGVMLEFEDRPDLSIHARDGIDAYAVQCGAGDFDHHYRNGGTLDNWCDRVDHSSHTLAYMTGAADRAIDLGL